MKIDWTNMLGKKIETEMTLREALDRSTYLHQQEQNSIKYAPTDSGNVRMDYYRENAAIIFALKNGGI